VFIILKVLLYCVFAEESIETRSGSRDTQFIGNAVKIMASTKQEHILKLGHQSINQSWIFPLLLICTPLLMMQFVLNDVL